MTSLAQLDLAFQLRGYAGRVHVELSANDEPRRIGQPLVAPDFDEQRFRGFPVLEAGIDYAGPGLNAAMGWLQVIRHIDTAGAEYDIAVDRFPLGPDDSPLYVYGQVPTFFDAPANPDHPDGTWQADTWLIAIPDVIRTRCIVALTGFRWGYRLRSGAPAPTAPRALSGGDWTALLPVLRREHPRWALSDA